MRCADCKHFRLLTIADDAVFDPGLIQNSPGVGHSGGWHGTYNLQKLEPNGCLVECDEGWCNYVGPEFGCVLFEKKDSHGQS